MSSTTTTGLTITKPTGVVAGDVMIVNIVNHGNTLASTSAGWTQVAYTNLGGGTLRSGTVLVKVAGASEAGGYTFVLGTGGGAPSTVGAIVAYSGVDTATPIEATGTVTVGALTNTVTAPTITTLSANARVVMFGMVTLTSGNGIPATYAGWSTGAPGSLSLNELYDYGSIGQSVGAADAAKISAGDTGAGTATASTVTENPARATGGLLVALKPLDSTAPTTATVVVPANNGIYRASTVPVPFSGQVADDASGSGLAVNSTKFTLYNGSQYWNGSTWQATPFRLAATNAVTSGGTAATWTSSATLPTWSLQTDGIFTVAAIAIDRSSNATTGTPISFTLDKTNPGVASVTSPVNLSAYNAAGVPSIFQGSAADNSGGSGLPTDSITFTLQNPSNQYWNGSAWQAGVFSLAATNTATTGNTSTTWTDNVTLPTWSLAGQAAGTYTVRATATDKAGNTFAGTAITFTLDKTNPITASVTTPVNLSAYNAAGVPSVFQGSAADNSGGSGLLANSTTFTLTNPSGQWWDGSSWQGTLQTLTTTHSSTTGNTSATWSDSVTLPTWSSATEGTYTVQATATDRAGNTLTGTAITFRLDNTDPITASVTSPVDLSVYSGTTVPSIFQGSAADNSDGAGLLANSTTFTLRNPGGQYWDGSSWQNTLHTLATTHSATAGDTSATWSDSVTLPTWTSATEGTYTVQATAVDKAGNTFTGTAITFRLDRTGPATASVTSPVDEAAYSAAGMPDISGQVADNSSGVGLPADSTTFTLRRPGGDYWTGSDWHPTLATLSAENSATTDGTGVPWTSSATLPDWATTDQGVYTVQATVADKAGNTYTGAAITFNLDRTDPTVATVTSPVDGVAYKAADVPAFSGDVADSIGRAGLYANSATFTLRNPGGDYWNGSDWQPASFELTATNAATIGGVSASWTGSATMPNWGTSVEGTYTVQATATDKAANTFTGTAITFNLDRTGPATASVTSPVDESAYKPADMPTFSGEAADNAGGAGIGADSTKFTLQRPNGDFWNGSGWQLASFDLTATNAATSGGTSATWTSSATMPDWSTSAEGTYTVQATATDKAGNTFTGGAITFNLDKTGPATASVTSPVDESAYKPADMPTFSGEAADNAGGAGIGADSTKFTLQRPNGDFWNGSGWQLASFDLTATNAATSGGTTATWTSSATMPDWDTSDEGTYTVHAIATDKAGNTLTGDAITFFLDRSDPTEASVTSPVDGSIYRPADMPTFSGEAADNAGGAGIGADSTKFTLQRPNGDFWNGSGWQLASFELTATNAATSGGTSATWTSSATMPDWDTSDEGTYTVHAIATDKAGNTLTGDAITFFLGKPHTVTATATAGGSIEPSGTWTGDYGSDSPTFTATPTQPGYRFEKFMDGAAELPATDVGGGQFAYKFSNVTTDHAIAASFIETHTITATAGDHGSIDPAGVVSVDEGADATFTFHPAANYHVATLTVGGTNVPSPGDHYHFTNVTASSTIAVTFAINTYTLTYNAGTGGKITGTTAQAVPYNGAGTQVTAVPNTGYRFVSWSDGLTTASRTDTNITANKTVTASFAVNTNMMTVWRFRNTGMIGNYLWTPDPSERDSVIANLFNIWFYEGPAFTINTANPLNSNMMWRFRNEANWTYLYTADPTEKQSIIDNQNSPWTYEGPSWNVSWTTPTDTPVWRFRCLKNPTYLWTSDPNEKLTIETTLQSDYVLEGIAYYLGQ